MSHTVVVVPCFNEANRLDVDAYCRWLTAHPNVSMLFVNDGSSDRTRDVLNELAGLARGRASLLDMDRNRGKAEVVRLGLLHAMKSNPDILGFIDADLATPLSELARLIALMEQSNIQLMMGARVSLLGRHIERSGVRHYLGRVFASAASLTLRLRIYDTQCGVKLFRPSAALETALNTPFYSRWVFDVELLGRMMHPDHGVERLLPSQIMEEPLLAWSDVPGSKLTPVHMLRSAIDLAKIAKELCGRRRVDL